MNTKEILAVYAPGETHFVGDGFKVHNFIPSQVSMEDMNPFVMLDYNCKYVFPATENPRGVGPHPHRGFETVTIAYKGSVEHADSAGSGGVIHEGDVQWMTAASGVLHKEFHEKKWSERGGEFHMVQLWVNLPKEFKMSNPHYQALSNSTIPRVSLTETSYIEVIAGEYESQAGAAKTFSPVHLFNVYLEDEESIILSFPEHFVTALLVIEGDLVVNNKQTVEENHFAVFQRKGENLFLKANKKAVILLMSAEPLNEPIASYGPFVMNTHQEIVEAIEDFREGKFGYLED